MTRTHRTKAALILSALLLLAPFVAVASGITQSMSLEPGNTFQVIPSGTPGVFVLDPTPAAGTLVSGRYDLPLIEGVPMCTDHDKAVWHPLVKRDAGGAIICTYGHTHGDNPHDLDAMLGALPTPNGQEISYPWQTTNSLGLENDTKHEFYAWSVIQGVSCAGGVAPLGMTDMRFEMHMDGSLGESTRYHSFFLQVRTCDQNDPNYHAIMSVGGHIDTGQFEVQDAANHYTHIANTGDPDNQAVGGGCRRIAGSIGFPLSTVGWYSCHKAAGTLGFGKEGWGQVLLSDPLTPQFTEADKKGPHNGSSHGFHIWQMNLQNGNGKQATNGVFATDYLVDRLGNIVTGCTPASVNCIPWKLTGVKLGVYQFRDDEHGLTAAKEYDVLSPQTGKSLIRYPN